MEHHIAPPPLHYSAKSYLFTLSDSKVELLWGFGWRINFNNLGKLILKKTGMTNSRKKATNLRSKRPFVSDFHGLGIERYDAALSDAEDPLVLASPRVLGGWKSEEWNRRHNYVVTCRERLNTKGKVKWHSPFQNTHVSGPDQFRSD